MWQAVESHLLDKVQSLLMDAWLLALDPEEHRTPSVNAMEDATDIAPDAGRPW